MADMNRTIEYQYTNDIARRAAWHFIWRTIRIGLIFAGIVMLVALFRILLGEITGATLGMLFLPLLFLVSGQVFVIRQMKLCDAMPDKSVSVEFTNDSLSVHTYEHDSELRWCFIRALWRFRTEWLIFMYSGSDYTVIPIPPLDAELQDFMISKIQENRGKII